MACRPLICGGQFYCGMSETEVHPEADELSVSGGKRQWHGIRETGGVAPDKRAKSGPDEIGDICVVVNSPAGGITSSRLVYVKIRLPCQKIANERPVQRDPNGRSGSHFFTSSVEINASDCGAAVPARIPQKWADREQSGKNVLLRLAKR